MATLRDALDLVFAEENVAVVHEYPSIERHVAHIPLPATGAMDIVFGGVDTTRVQLLINYGGLITRDVQNPANTDALICQKVTIIELFRRETASPLVIETETDVCNSVAEAVARTPSIVRKVLREVFAEWNMQALMDADWEAHAHGLK